MDSTWHVYIIESAKTNTLYTGICKGDIARRVKEHNTSHHRRGAKRTRVGRPWILVYSEPAASRSEASKREIAIKKLSRSQKLVLIAKR